MSGKEGGQGQGKTSGCFAGQHKREGGKAIRVLGGKENERLELGRWKVKRG